jgi:hypothetical protein
MKLIARPLIFTLAIMPVLFGPAARSQEMSPVHEGQRLAIMSPQCDMAAYRFQDLNHDQHHELFVVGKQGHIETWARNMTKDGVFEHVGKRWVLPFPNKSLLSLSSFLGKDEPLALLTLTPNGLWAYPVNPDGSIDPSGILVNRRMKCLFRVGQPVFSNFLQDINQDGRLDILVPIMNHCEIWINQGVPTEASTSAQEKTPRFSRMGRFPIKMAYGRRTNLEETTGKLSENFSIPSLLLKDINGDTHLDLVVRHPPHYDYYLLDKEGPIPDHPTVSLDLTLFKDTTPKGKDMPFGETLNLNNDPQLIESDLNNDTIPDYIISHRRKLWFFHSTHQGPQFTHPSSIIKMAEDITLFLPCPLDDDEYPDLLMVKVQIPTVSRLLRALFTDWKVKTESIGYQSKQGQSFELSSTWQGEIYLHLPSILSLINNAETLMNFDMDQKYGPAVHGDFNGDTILDVLLLNTDNGHFDLWFGNEGDPDRGRLNKPTPKEVSEKIRNLLFTKANNVWDIDRIKTALNALVNDHLFTVTGGEAPDLHLGQFKDRQNVKVISVDSNDDNKDELLFLYPDPQVRHLTIFELYTITPQ